MALASLNFAASNVASLAAKLSALAPTSLSALIPAKLAAIPVVAGLAVGTAAGASFIAAPSSLPAAKSPQVAAATIAPTVTPVSAAPAAAPLSAPAAEPRPCEAQTWPYIERKCMAGRAPEKRVRIVTAPRAGDAVDAAASAGLVTRDTVLRQPQNLDALPPVETKPVREKRRDSRKRDRHFSTQSYQVPYENGRSARPVIVVRPMRLDAFR